MKKVLLSLAVAAFLASCGGAEPATQEGDSNANDTTVVADTNTVEAPEAPVAEVAPDTNAVADTNMVEDTNVVDTPVVE